MSVNHTTRVGLLISNVPAKLKERSLDFMGIPRGDWSLALSQIPVQLERNSQFYLLLYSIWDLVITIIDAVGTAISG